MSYKFENKNILVTGSGRGIGRAIAIALARSGANVYALSKTKANLDSLIKEVPTVQPIHVDLQDWNETRKVVDEIEQLDGLVNNAAILPVHEDAVDVSKEVIDQILDVNLKAAINVMQVVGKKMSQAGKGGSIVNISSIGAHRAIRGFLSYGVAKAGLNMATKVFALELGKHKIRVNSVSSSVVRTDMINQYRHKLAAVPIPLGRVCEVEELADMVLFLLGDKSQMLTGSDVVIDGGHMCYLPV